MTNVPQSDYPARGAEQAATGSLWRSLAVLVVLLAVALVTQPPRAPAGVERRPFADGPVILHDGIALRKLVNVGPGNIKLALNPLDGQLYFLNPAAGIFRVPPTGPAEAVQVVSTDAFQGHSPTGMTIGRAPVNTRSSQKCHHARMRSAVRKCVARTVFDSR